MEEMTAEQITLVKSIGVYAKGTYVGYLADVTLRHPARSVMMSNMREAQKVAGMRDIVYGIIFYILNEEV